jgi:hypothetical protein
MGQLQDAFTDRAFWGSATVPTAALDLEQSLE